MQNLSLSAVTNPTRAERSRQRDLFSEPYDSTDFVVRASKRARRLTINVFPGGSIEIVAPVCARPADVQQFVRDNRAWIDSAVERLAGPFQNSGVVLPVEIHLPAIDKTWLVEYRDTPGNRRHLRQTGNRIQLMLDRSDFPAGRVLLQSWVKKQAKLHLVPWLSELRRVTGLKYRKIQIRGQRTRWGSYSGTGTMCLNYCLVFLAPRVARYLLIHELCHSRYLNHSERYWSLVAGFEPDYKRLDDELEQGWKRIPLWALPARGGE